MRAMASRKRICDGEFREGAVRIVTETEARKRILEVAEDLGTPSGTLHGSVSRARRKGSPSSGRLAARGPEERGHLGHRAARSARSG